MSDLLTYMPDFYSGVYEMEQLLEAQGKALDASNQKQEKILANQFIKQADEDGVKIFEEQLGITPSPNATLEERKQAIFIENAPPQELTKNYLRSTATMYGMHLDYFIDVQNHLVKVMSTGDVSQVQVTNLRNWLNHILPANMTYQVEITFTTQETSLELYSALATSYLVEFVSKIEKSQVL